MLPSFPHTVIVICGPTAVGKTAAAIQLAQQLNTQIVSADSRQCFRELNIGVAKPSADELAAVHHFFINSHSIHDVVDAAVYEVYALQALQTIFQTNNTAVVVGGTGLYIKALCEGMDDIPSIDPAIRLQIIKDFHEYGLEWLQQQVMQHDPAFWEVAEQQNPQRLMRGLEVILSTGHSITVFRRGDRKQRAFNIIKVGMELPRPELNERIHARIDHMMELGLLQEVEALIPHSHINALQTVGYSELFAYFNGDATLEYAVERIRINTRHYAKRQMTWFKKDPDIHWFSPDKIQQGIAGLLPIV